MKRHHWFPFYFERFLIGTSGMNDREVGAYLRLLIYQFDKGPIPNNHPSLKIPKVKAKFVSVIDPSSPHHGPVIDPSWINASMEAIKTRHLETGQKLSESGIKGNEKRWGAIANVSPPDRKKDKIIEQEKIIDKDVPLYSNYLIYLNKALNRKYRGDAKSKAQFSARVKDGYKSPDFAKAIQTAMNDVFHKEQNYKYLTPEFFTRADKLEKFMNQGVPITIVDKMRGYDFDQIIEEQVRPEDLTWAKANRSNALKLRETGISDFA